MVGTVDAAWGVGVTGCMLVVLRTLPAVWPATFVPSSSHSKGLTYMGGMLVSSAFGPTCAIILLLQTILSIVSCKGGHVGSITWSYDSHQHALLWRSHSAQLMSKLRQG